MILKHFPGILASNQFSLSVIQFLKSLISPWNVVGIGPITGVPTFWPKIGQRV